VSQRNSLLAVSNLCSSQLYLSLPGSVLCKEIIGKTLLSHYFADILFIALLEWLAWQQGQHIQDSNPRASIGRFASNCMTRAAEQRFKEAYRVGGLLKPEFDMLHSVCVRRFDKAGEACDLQYTCRRPTLHHLFKDAHPLMWAEIFILAAESVAPNLRDSPVKTSVNT
jgi:hypothetical protein